MSDQPRKALDPNKWKPGTYKAKAVDWYASKTKDGLPQVAILFQYDQDGEMRQLTWFGSFKEKALSRTQDVLILLGLRSPVSEMEKGREGGALSLTTEVNVVVEHRLFNGEVKAGIAWVNPIGGRGIRQYSLPPAEVKSLFAAVDQEFMATLIAKGFSPNQKTPVQMAMTDGHLNENDIPF